MHYSDSGPLAHDSGVYHSSPSSRRNRRKRSDPRRSIEGFSSENDDEVNTEGKPKFGRRVKKKSKAGGVFDIYDEAVDEIMIVCSVEYDISTLNR